MKPLSSSRNLAPTQAPWGLCQYPITPSFEENWKEVKKLFLSKPPKANFLVFPEMWLGSPKKKGEKERGEQENILECARFYKKILGEVKMWCAKNKKTLFFSQLEESKNKFYNTAYCINEKGKVAASYRKIHLFSFGGETKVFSAGHKPVTFKTEVAKMGMVVCYDIRFPELIRHLTHKGMQILVVGAQWPIERIDHWLTLLKARAIENQIYVVGVNRLGKKENQVFSGHSVVFDPWGNKLLELDENTFYGSCILDLKFQENIRGKYPFLKERKL